MRRIYRGIAWVIVGGVVVQAAAIAFAFGGVLNNVAEGGVLDKALLESRQGGGVGELGFWIHAIGGAMLIPLASVALLVVSFFTRAPRARLWALIILGLVAVQATLGFTIVGTPYLGLIHGANAIAILLAAIYAALRVGRPASTFLQVASSDAVGA
jgi:heme A synthase